MAQTPATPKTRRARIRLLSHLFGAQWLLRHDNGLQPSERAALNLRAHRAEAQATAVTFLIPLVGKHHVKDWQGTCERLNATLHSLLRQSCPDWHVIISGQDRPPAPLEDPRVTFLPFGEEVAGNDKWRKLAYLTRALRSYGPDAGYVMTFDADDVAHPDLVSHILKRQATGGYLAELGYVYDQGADRLALAGPPTLSAPLRKPFWKLCGSCAALRYDFTHDAEETEHAFIQAMSQHEHRMFPYLASLAGRPLTPLPGAYVTYLLNHGDNFGARRGRVSFKSRFVERFEITDPSGNLQIRRDFALPLSGST